MTAPQFIISILTLLILSSCDKTIQLAENDFRWIPYKGNETLVFNSNSGETDTIFLTGSGRNISPSDPLDFFPTNLESFGIGAKHSDPSPPGGKHRYLESGLLQISTTESKMTYMTVNLTAKDAWFYGGRFMYLKDLDTIPLNSLQTKSKTYNDVLLLSPESNEYFDRNNFITKVYWSKSQGLIRYDKKDNIYWELTSKYRL